jgi:6-phosphogluconate dehydrogenase
MAQCEIGLIGLATMGQNLALNMAGRGFRVAVHNRTVATARQFMTERAPGLPLDLGESLADFVALLRQPRTAMIMVKAGQPVDDMIAALAPLLEPGDLILDCGNSLFTDTERRGRELAAVGLEFMGVGVSGGEEGALRGPSIMPGGSVAAWVRVRPVLEAIAARVGGESCVTHVGPGGAGHFVKMVHNGIEYGDLQLIAEVYDLLRKIGGLRARELAGVFKEWNEGELSSYLVEISGRVLSEVDGETGLPLCDLILDRAGQKGTGRWTTQTALDLGEPIPTITAAVDARNLSAKLELRREARALPGPETPAPFAGDLIRTARAALYAARLCLYDQGIALLQAASRRYGYNLRISELARIWRGGCIIRSRLLDPIRLAFERERPPAGLLLDPEAARGLGDLQYELRRLVAAAVESGVGTPALSASLAYYDYYRSVEMPTNLIQAQRDLFGAHTFERTDRPGSFHRRWGEGE